MRQPIKESLRISGPYPYYVATGIIDYVDGYIFEGEYLLLAENGANIITRSAPIIYKTKDKFCVNNHVHIFKPENNNDIDFLEQLLENVKNIKLYIPEAEEQKRIGAFFKLFDEKLNAEKEKVLSLRKLKKGFMQKMFV